MRILLNATSEELVRLGGDFTLYQDWLRLNGEGLVFQLVPPHPIRRWHVPVRKGIEKLCRAWQPAHLRHRLFLASRFLYVPRKAVGGVDLLFSHIAFPWPPSDVEVPVVWSSQGISPSIYYERYNRGQWNVEDVAFVYRILGPRGDALVISTEACARNVVEWCPELVGKVYVVHAPVFVDTDAQLTKPSMRDGMIRLLFLGVDAVRKGLPEVVEAFRILQGKYHHLHLDIVSRPSAKLREKIEVLSGVSLHLSSPKVDVKALMDRADIFVLPTYADTYALAAVEAMAHKCAIVISDLEPLPEVAPDGEVGFNVPAGDVGALVEKIEALIKNDTLLRQMQENAYHLYLQRHHPDVVASKLRWVFEQAIQRRAEGRAATEKELP